MNPKCPYDSDDDDVLRANLLTVEKPQIISRSVETANIIIPDLTLL
jgi:hypothetical protein